MKLHLEVRSYRRPFKRPLQTAHGTWKERRGFLVRVTGKEGTYGYGEVAPVPWLGSESLEDAAGFLKSFQKGSRAGDFGAVSRLPACRFAIDSAMTVLGESLGELPIRPIEVAALLPSGRACLEAMEERLKAGYRTFKWKVGVEPARQERDLFRELRGAAPEEVRFRLDANGGLSLEEAREWLKLLDEMGADFLEQPLSPGEFGEMKKLSREFGTPLALDESIGGARQFEQAHRAKWTGLYVVKPAVFGAMREGVALLPPLRPRLIFSSVFETSIGFEAVLRWASRWQADGAAAGLGTQGYLEEDGMSIHPEGPKLIRGLIDPARVWEQADPWTA